MFFRTYTAAQQLMPRLAVAHRKSSSVYSHWIGQNKVVGGVSDVLARILKVPAQEICDVSRSLSTDDISMDFLVDLDLDKEQDILATLEKNHIQSKFVGKTLKINSEHSDYFISCVNQLLIYRGLPKIDSAAFKTEEVACALELNSNHNIGVSESLLYGNFKLLLDNKIDKKSLLISLDKRGIDVESRFDFLVIDRPNMMKLVEMPTKLFEL